MAPLFVTWYETSKRGEEVLRGCLGYLKDLAWEHGIADYALRAARDIRFIRLEDLATLQCRVSVLHSFETCRDPLRLARREAWDYY